MIEPLPGRSPPGCPACTWTERILHHPRGLPAREPGRSRKPRCLWGFRDTQFEFSENGHARIRGNRYELSGKELPRFLPWVREVLGVQVDPREVHQPSYPTSVHEPRITPEFLAEPPGLPETGPDRS